MLDAALQAASHKRDGFAYGRALCGVAFTCWSSDRLRGYKAAKAALETFKRLPNSSWDRANAIRHMGLCIVKRDRKKGLALYRQAIQIFDSLSGDGARKGRAQCLLSIGQSGLPDEQLTTEAAVVLHFDLAAAAEFRALGDGRSLNATFSELPKAESRLPRLPAYEKLRLDLRSLLQTRGEDEYRSFDCRSMLEERAFCLKLDLAVGRLNLAADDLEMMLGRHLQGYHPDPSAGTALASYYDLLCRRLRRSPMPSLVRQWSDARRNVVTSHSAAFSEKYVLQQASRLTHV